MLRFGEWKEGEEEEEEEEEEDAQFVRTDGTDQTTPTFQKMLSNSLTFPNFVQDCHDLVFLCSNIKKITITYSHML